MTEPWYIILDMDGVLITTPLWKPDTLHKDGYSDFNETCVQNFNKLASMVAVEVMLSSSRRKTKTLEEFRQIFDNRGMKAILTGFIPVLATTTTKSEEIKAYLEETKVKNYLIIDDDLSLNDLPTHIRENCIFTTYARGFDEQALAQAREVIKAQCVRQGL
jgi:hypothetical protein